MGHASGRDTRQVGLASITEWQIHMPSRRNATFFIVLAGRYRGSGAAMLLNGIVFTGATAATLVAADEWIGLPRHWHAVTRHPTIASVPSAYFRQFDRVGRNAAQLSLLFEGRDC
jgi:hypothetical protein